jgi:hypothetical protein
VSYVLGAPLPLEPLPLEPLPQELALPHLVSPDLEPSVVLSSDLHLSDIDVLPADDLRSADDLLSAGCLLPTDRPRSDHVRLEDLSHVEDLSNVRLPDHGFSSVVLLN